MSTEHQLEYYKLSHETISRINARRLKVHVDRIYRMERNYYCSCCGMTEYDIHYEEGTDYYESEKAKHMAIKRYLHFIVKTLKEKPDYKVISEDNEKRRNRRENRRFKGSQKKTKGKRKAERYAEKRRNEWLMNKEREKKQRKHSLAKILPRK